MKRFKDMNFKDWVKTISVIYMITGAFVMTMTFFNAFFNPDMSTSVVINTYGEAWPEAIMLSIFVLSLLSYGYFEFIQYLKERREVTA